MSLAKHAMMVILMAVTAVRQRVRTNVRYAVTESWIRVKSVMTAILRRETVATVRAGENQGLEMAGAEMESFRRLKNATTAI